jgi:hypothetical protein
MCKREWASDMARRANSARQFFAPQFQIQFEKVGAVTAQIGGVEFTARGAGDCPFFEIYIAHSARGLVAYLQQDMTIA